jgi:DNA-binding transcriptional regulator YiaG
MLYERSTIVLTHISPVCGTKGNSHVCERSRQDRQIECRAAQKVANRASEILAEEMSLRDLRKARKLTQARIAKTLGITQDSFAP